jgi:flavodoxin I
MAKVGIFFGTDTGNTRRVAKDIATALGTVADKPVNIRNASVENLLQYPVLILGTPTYGEGELPGLAFGTSTESWLEFLPKLDGHDFKGKTVAIYGLGNQKSYPDDFVSAVYYLHKKFSDCGAHLIGSWSTEGYHFKHSKAVVDDHFLGLALDQENQKEFSRERLAAWLNSIAVLWA